MSRGVGTWYNLGEMETITQKENIAADIIKFAQDNELQIHPGQDPETWAELVIKKGGCPCVPGRPECPCEFALEDIKELNRCRCGLFVNGAYLEDYARLKAERKQGKRWKRKQGKSSY